MWDTKTKQTQFPQPHILTKCDHKVSCWFTSGLPRRCISQTVTSQKFLFRIYVMPFDPCIGRYLFLELLLLPVLYPVRVVKYVFSHSTTRVAGIVNGSYMIISLHSHLREGQSSQIKKKVAYTISLITNDKFAVRFPIVYPICRAHISFLDKMFLSKGNLLIEIELKEKHRANLLLLFQVYDIIALLVKTHICEQINRHFVCAWLCWVHICHLT